MTMVLKYTHEEHRSIEYQWDTLVALILRVYRFIMEKLRKWSRTMYFLLNMPYFLSIYGYSYFYIIYIME